VIVVGSYLLIVILMAIFENSLIFIPSVYPAGDWEPVGLEFEDAQFEAEDGTRLHGWYVPAKNPRAVVLFAHGNAGNITHRVDVADGLANLLGASVLVFDYRGYGRSEGHPSERGVLSDARAARAWLAQRAGVDESEIVLMGESLGGAVMVDLAASDGARGLVLENTFTSLPDVAAYHYPFLPVRLVMRSQLDSARKIRDYHGPLLQFHGDMDTIIPFKLGQKLFDAANQPKRLVVIPFADHNDPRTKTFYQELDRFFAELPAAGNQPAEAKEK
jgi:fermentation-respiration switch protein FrsA (DUF1100 family)